MLLNHLCYYSRAASPITEEDVKEILSIASENNRKYGITGVLVYAEQIFLQVIEGHRDNLNYLYCSILHDARHYDCTLLYYGPIAHRRYFDWDMGYIEGNEVSRILQLEFGATENFDPSMMNYEQALGFLERFVQLDKLK